MGHRTAIDLSKFNNRFIRHVNVPSNLGTIDTPSGRALGVGQCGDSIEVTLSVTDERITDIRYQPRGCGYTIACASAMSELARNLTLEQALEISPLDVETELGGLPEDHLHCARLAVNTLGRPLPIAIGVSVRRRLPPRTPRPRRKEPMPIFDIHCPSCGYQGEVLVLSSGAPLTCPSCGGSQTQKQMSPTSTLTGSTRRQTPGPGDHGCCGSRPAEAGCAGPGSCCGRTQG